MTIRRRPAIHGIAILIIMTLLVLGPRWLVWFNGGISLWLWEISLLMLFTLVSGHYVTGAWLGAFTNERNRISLSQTQSVLWTVLILSAFLAGAHNNLERVVLDPLEIVVPESLWILMGISIVSLVGTPMLSSRRKSQSADPQEEATAVNILVDQGRDPLSLTMSGRLVANEFLKDARWSDLFEAEEVSRAGRIDFSKVQMTMFTVAVGIMYAYAISKSLGQETGFHEFPSLSETMVFLIGISHAGYLVNKVSPEREGIH